MRIALLLWLMACSAQGQALYESLLLLSPAAAGGGCTLNAGNIVNESWEGSDTLTWSDTGTVDRNAALSGTSPCSGLGSQCLQVDWDGMATRPYSTYDRGSNLTTSTLYYRFYFIIVSHSTVDSDKYGIFTTGEDVTPGTFAQFRITVNNATGQLQIVAITGGSVSGTINISVATWYRCEVKYVNNSTAMSEVKIFDSAGSQVGSTQTWDTGNNFVRYVHTGLSSADDTKAMKVQVDGFGLSDVGYIGQ